LSAQAIAPPSPGVNGEEAGLGIRESEVGRVPFKVYVENTCNASRIDYVAVHVGR
jgi:hypothetical protein